MGRIIREQIPDRDGHTIPPTVTSGSSELWDLDHPGLGHVFEGKLVLDKTYGRAFYGCNICCRQYGAALHVTPFSGPVGGGDYDTVTYRECDGTEYDGTAMAYGWFSYDTSIATLPDRYLSLVGVGSTTTKADIDLITSRCLPYTEHPQQSVAAGKTVDLAGTACNANPNSLYNAAWGDLSNPLQCLLAQDIPVPSGGSCVRGGITSKGTTKTCYQTNNNGCQTTYCAVDTRIVDAQCQTFLDQNAVTITKVPAGCP